jgi:hypothetical protein
MAANPPFIALDFGEGRQVLAGVVSEGRVANGVVRASLKKKEGS